MSTRYWKGTSSGDLTTAGNWSGGSVPVAGDTVIFQPGYTYAPSSNLQGLNTSTLGGALGPVVFLPGFSLTGGTTAIGSQSSYLQFTTSRLDYWCSAGTVYLDLEASNIGPDIQKTGSATDGYAGLYLKGSDLGTLTVRGGIVGLAMLGTETSTVAEARCAGSQTKLYLGSGVTATTVYGLDQGTIIQRCASTTTKIKDANLYTEETGAVTTMTAYGTAKLYPYSTGIITTLNIEDPGCLVDLLGSTEARTITTCNWKRGKLKYDAGIVTIGTLNVGLTGRTTDGTLL